MPLGGLNNEQDLLNWLRQRFPILSATDRLAKLSGLDMGAGTVTGNGTATTTVTVTHGLGVAPSVVVALAGASTINVSYSAVTASQFTLGFRHVDNVAWASTQNFCWIAAV